MSRRASGLVGVWAEVQRQQQRREQAEARQRREQERQFRAHQRRQEQDQRDYRHAEARRRTEELQDRVAALEGLLAAGCRAPAFRPAALLRPEEVPPFSPGPLEQPVPLPDPNRYRVDGGGWTAGRRDRAQAQARAQYERDWQAARAAEAQRLQQLAAYRSRYDQWATAQLTQARRHNAQVAEVAAAVGRGEPEAVVEYFTAALHASTAWPEHLPRRVSAAYDAAARQLVLDWELPGYAVVPGTRSVRYMPGTGQDKETARPVGQRRALYRDVLAQCLLLVLRDLFAADESGALESVALNGFVEDHDPVTGRRAMIVLATVMAPRATFAEFHLEQVDAVACLVDGLSGQLSARPDQLTAVRPVRRPEDVGNQVVTHDDDPEPDLFAMDPLAFESLVAELFRAMGMRAVTTERSGDGGVDVDAVDPTPVRGGTIVVQVKRYRGTVPPSAVRDLYGTVQDRGANKGVLVTTSGFGPGSHTFASGKPLELISGGELVDLLHRHGLGGRLGEGAPPAPAPSAPQVACEPPPEDRHVLGMTWSGNVPVDICALVCAGETVLGDDWFVFFNNPGTPDGAVSTLPASAGDRAALQVTFSALPERADRLVLVAATDPEADPDADLSGFTDARISLRDTAREELGRLDVSDGRAGETALVLGSFRRRPGGDWDFVVGGKGYPGGLTQLLPDHGIAVE